MGSDFYFSANQDSNNPDEKPIPLGVGNGSIIKKAIIDKNARIGEGVYLSPFGLKEGWADESQGIYVVDGILVVIKNAKVASGTRIGE